MKLEIGSRSGVDRIFKTKLFIASAIILVIAGCNKDKDPEPSHEPVKCFLVKRYENYTSGGLVVIQQTVFAYGDNDQVTGLERTYDGTTSNVVFSYDPNGNLLLGESSNGAKTLFMHDSNNRLIRTESYNGAVMYSATEFEYNTNDQLIKAETLEVSSAGTTSKGSYEIFEYADLKKNPTKSSFFSKEGVFYSSYEFTYDNFKTPRFDQWKMITERDTENNVVRTTYRDSNSHTFTQTTAYEYNANGYPIHSTTTSNLTNLNITVEYTYDCK